MNKLFALVLYVVVFIPVSLYRQVTQSSVFGRKAYQAASGWDLPNE